MGRRHRRFDPDRLEAVRKRVVPQVVGALYGAFLWLGHHLRGFYSVVGLYFVLALALAVLAVMGFAGLANLVGEGVTQPIDNAILLWIGRRRTPWLDRAALEITVLGSGSVVVMTVVVASAFLWLTRHRYSALLLWIAVGGALILNAVLKALIARPRPQLIEWRTPYAGFTSFPSGHAMAAVVVYGVLAYLVTRLEPGLRVRRATFLIVIAIILLIGLSRIYLGVHYPSDVLAGYVIGFGWATLCAAGIEVVRYFRSRRPGIERVEAGLEKGLGPIGEIFRRHRPGRAGGRRRAHPE